MDAPITLPSNNPGNIFLEIKITINAAAEGHRESQFFEEASRPKLMHNKQIMSNPDTRFKKLPHQDKLLLADRDSDIFFLHDFQKEDHLLLASVGSSE